VCFTCQKVFDGIKILERDSPYFPYFEDTHTLFASADEGCVVCWRFSEELRSIAEFQASRNYYIDKTGVLVRATDWNLYTGSKDERAVYLYLGLSIHKAQNDDGCNEDSTKGGTRYLESLCPLERPMVGGPLLVQINVTVMGRSDGETLFS
jgi:hypothetical protein